MPPTRRAQQSPSPSLFVPLQPNSRPAPPVTFRPPPSMPAIFANHGLPAPAASSSSAPERQRPTFDLTSGADERPIKRRRRQDTEDSFTPLPELPPMRSGTRAQPITIDDDGELVLPSLSDVIRNQKLKLPEVRTEIPSQPPPVQEPPQPERSSNALLNMTCVICMDRPTDLTAGTCGHVFCHSCLMEALLADENRVRMAGENRKTICPICRKPLNRKKKNGTSDLIPLLFQVTPRPPKRKRVKSASPVPSIVPSI